MRAGQCSSSLCVEKGRQDEARRRRRRRRRNEEHTIRHQSWVFIIIRPKCQ
ncbi:hypothetical protein I3842_16G099200 [Carya illinoinensis]|uniref:Uncharacterized protein n=1 Tax=Carya illinoinensis TaxID=32201 RepID=A0A922A3G5_CARIL|nr:hypothetical protein I3842_16G099200 [Carya illinoinensis]